MNIGDKVTERWQSHGIIATVINVRKKVSDTVFVDVEYKDKNNTNKTATLSTDRLILITDGQSN